MHPILVEQAKARLTEMKQAAENLTDALGLPRDATYDVLSMMYGAEPSQLGISQRAGQLQASTDILRARIFKLSEDFLSTRLKGQVATFRAAWEKLKTLPLETLGQLGQTPAASQGLGFAGGSQQILPIISTVSWAVINWSSLSQTKTPEEIITQIAEKARTRGCSDAVGYALAKYLQAHLRNS